MKHFALFDVLYLGQNLETKIDDFSINEIQILSYLGCLLSIYDGNNSSDWGYFFSKNSSGYPYSIELNNSMEILSSRNMIKQNSLNGKYFNTDTAGNEFIDKMSNQLSIYSNRKRYLDASLNCITLAPFGVIRTALLNEPVLASAKRKTSVLLLEESDFATNLLYEQFEELRTAINNEYESLLIPAFTWLSGNLNHQIG
ncbi:hypothetical protein [Polaribacter sp.]|uniref:hypothetical protein n=1 Tax=Polaribacter sp. TaxID=1920175 RepID=UPI003EF3A2EA